MGWPARLAEPTFHRPTRDLWPVSGHGPPPRRLVLINKALGLHAPDFFPEKAGRDFELSPYLKPFAALRGDFTVFSGLSHPEAGGGHSSEASFLTAAPHAGTPAFRNTISLDQLIAEQIGAQTRHPFLAFGSHSGSLSWTRNGVQIPPDKDPTTVFRRLFIAGTPEEIREQERQSSWWWVPKRKRCGYLFRRCAQSGPPIGSWGWGSPSLQVFALFKHSFLLQKRLWFTSLICLMSAVTLWPECWNMLRAMR